MHTTPRIHPPATQRPTWRRVLLLILSSLMLAASVVAVATPARAEPTPDAGKKTGTGDISKPVQIKVAPVDGKRASLTLDVATDPPAVEVGGKARATVTVANQGDAAARDVVVTVPVPEGTVPAGGQGHPKDGWRWARGELAAGAIVAFTADVDVVSLPAGRAVVVRAQVTARDQELPIEDAGGALVSQKGKGTGQADFRPGQPAALKADDDSVEVAFSANASAKGLTLRAATEAEQRAKNKPVPPAVAGAKRGLGTVFLDAVDSAGGAVHQFSEPVTITARYTPEQLEVLGIAEDDLTLFWYDDEHRMWVPLPTMIDAEQRTASAPVDHFSAFQLSDGSSPSAAFLPSLQGWQANQQTGAASYSYPLDVPSGPAGLKPNLELSYNSAATDGDSGKRPKQQAGWVGKGWSLDTGSVSRNKITIDPATNRWVDHFALTFDGRSYDLVRAEPLPGNTGVNDRDPTHWAWRSTDESFVRARVVVTGTSTDGNPGRGGMVNGVWQPRHTWKVWAKNGALYEFAEDLWSGWDRCAIANAVDLEAYRWLLSKTTDTHGNTITYNYARNSLAGPQKSCDPSNYARGTVDRDAWPTSITWGANPGTGAVDRYKVDFVSSGRENDTVFEGADNQYMATNGQSRQTRKLLAVRVWADPSGSWQRVRQYNFGYDYSLLSDQTLSVNGTYTGNASYPKLTLRSFQRIANDGVTALPAQAFTYNTVRGSGQYANGGWNRLARADNGQGGVVSFTYQNIGAALNRGLFANHHRIVTRSVDDGRGNRPLWRYSYGTASMNSLGTTLGGANAGTQANPNSAALYFNKYWEPSHPYDNWLAHRALKEFRGHDYVKETAPDGTLTEHWFHLGDHPCGYPKNAAGGPLTGAAAIQADGCFQQLRDREFLKGREYRTRILSNAGAILRETETNFTVEFASYSDAALTGLWRAFVYESEAIGRTHNGGADPVTKTTRYRYDPALQVGGRQYGNLTDIEEYGDTGALERVTRRLFTTRDDTNGAYIVDRVWMELVLDGERRLLAVTQHFYDTANQQVTMIGTKGDVTRTSKYFDVPLQASAQGVTMHGADTTFLYDAYGNQVQTTTYAGPGSRLWNGGGNWTISAPGNGSAARITRAEFDTTFHAMPVKVTGPTGLAERGGYDLRMGLLTSATDANGNQTIARYDAFGRMVKLIRPGDSESVATIDAMYFDTEKPFRYVYCAREIKGQGGCRPIQRFYDGLGREIQTKSESGEGSQNIVVDRFYDGLDRVVKESRPRYRDETPATTFWKYVAPGPDAEMRWTSTTYDGLGRPTAVAGPVGETVHRYTVAADGPATVTVHDSIDANRHRTQQRHDAFGRLVKVGEMSGQCDNATFPCGAGQTPWSLSATTSYGYSPHDLLTEVVDQKGNRTSMSYDSLGRKLTMGDPDMGSWRYGYDANGNLVTQRDANNKTLTFKYDALDRLTAKAYPDGTTSTYRYDEAVPNGKGQRTSMTSGTETTRWQFDERLHRKQTDHVVAGKTLTFKHTYDSADRVATITYPSGEVVSHTYDAAWRQTKLCGTTCYVAGASYTALDQPDAVTFGPVGGNLVEDWSYDAVSARAAHLVVGPHFNRSYRYDAVGNVKEINDNLVAGAKQTFDYDHRDRLTQWTPTETAAKSSYAYDEIGNLTNKDGEAYDYAMGATWNGGPHAVKAKGAQPYRYDANGNLTSGGGRTFTWNVDNLPTSIKGPDGVTESYGYDANGERVTVTRSGATTIYAEGLWEEVVGGAVKSYYNFGGRIVAVRQGAAVTALHGDHLGSVSLATNEAGAAVSRQEFDPWGKVRSGAVTQTTLNFTGQHLDRTGLLYYHARMYDPALGRFASADSIVPGRGGSSGSGETPALRPLAVDYHELTHVAGINEETKLTQQQGFHFQLDDEGRKQEKRPWGPADPQNLNRYTYVLNNPVKYEDPSGHSWYLNKEQGEQLVRDIESLVDSLDFFDFAQGTMAGLAGFLGSIVSKSSLSYGFLWGILAPLVGSATVAIGLTAFALSWVVTVLKWELMELARLIDKHNGDKGVAIATDGGSVIVLNRETGAATRRSYSKGSVGRFMVGNLPATMRLGDRPQGDARWCRGFHFRADAWQAPFACA